MSCVRSLKTLTILFSLAGVLANCAPPTIHIGPSEVQPGEPPAVDSSKLETESGAQCPTGKFFRLFKGDIRIVADEWPSPMLFALRRGGGRCADLKNVDHGGIDNWLIVDYDHCVPNGALWKTESLANAGDNNVIWRLRPIENSDTNFVRFRTSYGYPLATLRKRIGLVTYTCQD